MCIERCPHGSGRSGPVRGCLPHGLDIDVQRLKPLKANHLSQKYSREDNVKYFPQAIAIAKGRIKNAQEDIAIRDANTTPIRTASLPWWWRT